jgi:hypothetical protein
VKGGSSGTGGSFRTASAISAHSTEGGRSWCDGEVRGLMGAGIMRQEYSIPSLGLLLKLSPSSYREYVCEYIDMSTHHVLYR